MTVARKQPPEQSDENATSDGAGQVSEVGGLDEARSGGADAVEKTTGVAPEHDR